MERETRVFETPAGKHSVKVYTYLTGREFEYIQDSLLQAMSVKSALATETDISSLNVEKLKESTHRLIEKLVVSVDDGPGGVEPVLDMRQEDYEFVLNELNTLAKKN